MSKCPVQIFDLTQTRRQDGFKDRGARVLTDLAGVKKSAVNIGFVACDFIFGIIRQGNFMGVTGYPDNRY